MRGRPLLLAALLLAAACPHDDGGDPPNLVSQDNASDEAWLAFKDAVDQGLATSDDARAAALTAPTSGAALPGSTAATFSWTLPATAGKTPRHGVDTGRLVWLELSGGGLTAPINVVSITSTSWTADAESWTTIRAATGTVEAKLYTATFDRGIVTDGPYQPTAGPVTFTIAP